MALSRAVLIGMCPVKPQGWVMNARGGPTHFPNMAGVRSAEASWKHLMARKLAVQSWLSYWFCSVMQEVYFCPCWHSQETPFVLFYCFHFPVFICSFLGEWLFIMGPAEKKSTTEHKAQSWGDDLSLLAALHFCSPESNVERQFTLANICSFSQATSISAFLQFYQW